MHTFKFHKNFWQLIVTTTAKSRLAPNFVGLVQAAYAKTPEGSFVNTLNDVVATNWIALDWDKDEDADSCIFFRKSRPNESWKGFKIQGIGHDTQRTSIDKVLIKVKDQLIKKGWWIEASDAFEHILYKDRRVPVVTDEDFLVSLFPTSNLQLLNDRQKPGKYVRGVAGKSVKESVFGNPTLK